MKKFRKILISAICLIIMSTVFVFAAGCGGEKEYVYEAEHIKVEGLYGGGTSGSPSGLNMLTQSSNASNGWFLGSTSKEGLVLTFNVSSSADAKATLSLGLNSTIGAMTLNPTKSMAIKINGTALTYSDVNIKSNTSTNASFTKYTLSPQIDLKAGENVITFTILDNEYNNGQAGGPDFDYISLKTGSKLTWEIIDNPKEILGE